MTSQSDSLLSESSPAIPRLTYSVEESAQALGVSKPTIYRLLARRILRPVPGVRHKRIPVRQVESLVHHGLN